MMSPFGSLVCLSRALPGGSPWESFATVLDHQVRKFRQALDPQLRPLPRLRLLAAFDEDAFGGRRE
jgi:hypothetical protein